MKVTGSNRLHAGAAHWLRTARGRQHFGARGSAAWRTADGCCASAPLLSGHQGKSAGGRSSRAGPALAGQTGHPPVALLVVGNGQDDAKHDDGAQHHAAQAGPPQLRAASGVLDQQERLKAALSACGRPLGLGTRPAAALLPQAGSSQQARDMGSGQELADRCGMLSAAAHLPLTMWGTRMPMARSAGAQARGLRHAQAGLRLVAGCPAGSDNTEPWQAGQLQPATNAGQLLGVQVLPAGRAVLAAWSSQAGDMTDGARQGAQVHSQSTAHHRQSQRLTSVGPPGSMCMHNQTAPAGCRPCLCCTFAWSRAAAACGSLVWACYQGQP